MIYEIKTVNGVKTKVPLTGNGYGLPLGTWISYEGTCPDGFIESEQTFNTTTYASLYALLGTNKVPARFDHSVLSDWEDITISTDANNPTIVPYEGFIHFEQSDNSNEVAEFKVYVNDVQIVSIRASSYASRRAGQGVTLPVKKGDSVYANIAVAQSKARYYRRHLAIKATPAYVEPDTVSDMVHTMRVQDSYSTEEVNTGKKWIDGKPIYRKVFSTTISGSPVPIDASNLNIDKLLNAGHGYCVDTNNNMTSIPYNWNSQYCINIYYNISQQKICVNSSGYNGSTAVFAIEYTKTTD